MSEEFEIKYSRDDMIGRLRVDPDFARRLWAAFGFTAGDADAQAFNDSDLAALAVFVGLDGALKPAAQLASARVIGQSTSRLAQWQATEIHTLANDPDNTLTTEQIIAALSHIQRLIWRRHLDTYLANLDEATAVEAATDGSSVIIGFADIVGYTSLSRRLGLQQLEDLIETFGSGAYRVISGHGGTVVKEIGDAVMFTAPDAASAAEIALDLHALTADSDLPQLRIGMASGIALERLGDVFGEPVNIAARLAAAAYSGTTLIDETLAEALHGDPEFYVNPIGTQSVRGYRRLKSHTLVRNRYAPSLQGDRTAADPVDDHLSPAETLPGSADSAGTDDRGNKSPKKSKRSHKRSGQDQH
ncbi:adenylate cyclase [Gordonia hirsuta DSM 44140 = NBRC 16056]|uniref:Adenylate cyclase n=1 Tax=Gordonia hirsuta DSM 44140 = NBRC 16056 TaxID=1121927 RepID=L7LCK1_9ACTN|nr:adenylate/guanylate cyclase domain-containing protein [Gordonia hirsuta]GAC57807.1 adenylate cyclase [Gordonia hirsuta DSM 44140 = NBRC 16056]